MDLGLYGSVVQRQAVGVQQAFLVQLIQPGQIGAPLGLRLSQIDLAVLYEPLLVGSAVRAEPVV